MYGIKIGYLKDEFNNNLETPEKLKKLVKKQQQKTYSLCCDYEKCLCCCYVIYVYKCINVGV